MLNRKAEAVMELLRGILGNVITFCLQIRLNQNAWETPRVFAALSQTHAAFRKSSRFLFTGMAVVHKLNTNLLGSG